LLLASMICARSAIAPVRWATPTRKNRRRMARGPLSGGYRGIARGEASSSSWPSLSPSSAPWSGASSVARITVQNPRATRWANRPLALAPPHSRARNLTRLAPSLPHPQAALLLLSPIMLAPAPAPPVLAPPPSVLSQGCGKSSSISRGVTSYGDLYVVQRRSQHVRTRTG